jgi:vacuolar protein sorting-associated protein 54
VHVGDDEENCLRDQLLPIVVGLLRTSKLPAVLRVYRDTLNTDIKAAIRTVVAELLPVLFTRAPDGDLPSADRQADMEGV